MGGKTFAVRLGSLALVLSALAVGTPGRAAAESGAVNSAASKSRIHGMGTSVAT